MRMPELTVRSFSAEHRDKTGRLQVDNQLADFPRHF